MFCKSGVCTTAQCGNGVVDPGEACDLGAQNGTGVGCSASCQLDCATSADCADTNSCNGNESCVPTTVGGQMLMKCQPGTNATKCSACTGGLCDGAGTCTASVCGDGCVDASKGETCDPPNGTTCDPTCHLAPVCGNGTLEGSEQCDDGNLFDLDGCDSGCKYEVVARMTSASIQTGFAPAFCVPQTNQLGNHAFSPTALNQLNPDLQSAIDTAATNILTQFLGLDDLTGVADANGLTIGMVSGSPDAAKGAWPGNNPIDWWFIADTGTIGSNGLPTGILTNGSLFARSLAAGPSDVNLKLLLGGSPALLEMRGAKIAATINGAPVPNVPAPPPSKLAAGLTVFQTMTGSGTGQGLCGNVTVESLASIPIPQTLASNCSAFCAGSHAYTACGAGGVTASCNSLLDVLVGGCAAPLILCTNYVSPTQPDVPAGAAVTTLTLGAGNKVVQPTAGNKDAYSVYLKFDANRTHLTGESCWVTANCQAGKTCVGGICR
jgi:cysteine-rich repeat protein